LSASSIKPKVIMDASNTAVAESAQPLGRVMFLDGQGELPMLEVTTPWSRAEMYLHGAHVTDFTLKNEPRLLFMSQCSRFEADQPIRGGIPVIFPWFGPREGMPQHGFARLKTWDLKEFSPAPDGSVSIRFRLPDCPEASAFPPFTADYVVTVDQALTLKLIIKNTSAEESFTFENCLHSYFEVGDVTAIGISGLKGTTYLDKVVSFASRTQTDDPIMISSEVDRIYLNTTEAVEITDSRLSRKIRVEKQGSVSTIVWNPWISKAQQMPDFANDEYRRMVCVESGNVGSHQITLPPGEVSTLTVRLSSERLE
jgi:glucose-6-phosphate 1-epimerase